MTFQGERNKETPQLTDNRGGLFRNKQDYAKAGHNQGNFNDFVSEISQGAIQRNGID